MFFPALSLKKFFSFLLVLTNLFCFAGDIISSRQKFFSTVQKDPAAARKYLKDKDPEIRRYALYRVLKGSGTPDLALLKAAFADPEESIRITALLSLSGSEYKKNRQITALLDDVAKNNSSPLVRRFALRAAWPFHREIKLLRDDPTWDYEVKTVKSFHLEKLPWLFAADPRQEGHIKGFFKTDFNDSKWKKIRMGNWEKQGFPGYDGTAWYRIKFTMPEKIDSNAVEIVFQGVDESAWVWLNGIYLGSHDIGPGGWNKTFAVDCRNEIRWGKENVLTVRVYDEAFAGGIYKPVRVDVLK